MLGAILDSYSIILNEVKELVEGLPPDAATLQFPQIKNHAIWTLGHLAFSAQAIGEEIRLEHWLPPEWTPLFRTGSEPKDDPLLYPSATTLLDALWDAKERLSAQLNALPPEDLNGPLPDFRFRSLFASTAHAVLHILVGHTSYHHGQLVQWRNALRNEKGI